MAQDRAPVETRVNKLEKEMRSVQRRVFAGQPPAADTAPADAGAPASLVTDLHARIDGLERQLATLTGQLEESVNRVRTLEEEARRARDAQAAAPIQAAPPPPAPESEAPAPIASATDPEPASADPAENAYLTGYRLWEAKRYDESVAALREITTKHPKHRRASWARNLQGRAYLDDGKPATAAEAFLANYQELPTGDRAADSLYFLGQALIKLNKPEQACKVYDELSDVYGTTMRDFLKANLPAARKQAKCAA